MVFAVIGCAMLSFTVQAGTCSRLELPEIGFALHLTTAATNAPEAVVESVQMSSFAVSEKEGRKVLVWRGHPKCGADFTVTAELAPTPENDGWEYAFRYGGNRSGMGVRLIEFPVVVVPRTDATELFVPRHCGLIRRPKWAEVKPGANIQTAAESGIHFIASMDGGGDCWYMDQRGDARLRPNWAYASNGKAPHTLTLGFRYAPQLTTANLAAGELPFGGTIRKFRGDWFAAAKIYRKWALEQPWAKAAFARPQDKLRKIAIWFWNRGRVDQVVPPVERFQALSGLPVALDWYWWHKVPYDVGYPFFWPPREGEEKFASAVRRLVAKGFFVQPYTNGVSWDKVDPTWEEEGRLDAIMEKDGSTRGHQYNVYVPSALSVMCGTAPHLHARLREVMRNLARCGLPGVYMDQVGGCTVRACWSPDHPHAPGGGTLMTDGYRKLFMDVKADNPGMLLSTEYTPEAYIDVVDSAINLVQESERFGSLPIPEAETVPAFLAVYHGAMAVYGSYAMIDGIPPWDPTWPESDRWPEEKPWVELYPDQFAIEFARGVAMGMQPMVHQLRMEHFDDPRYASNFGFMADTAKFYHANLDFLYDGEMCAPGKLECASQPVELFIRGIYTKPEKARLVRYSALPTMLHSVWRAKDGRVAAVLCNWTRSEQRYSLSAPDISDEGTIPARSWKLVLK